MRDGGVVTPLITHFDYLARVKSKYSNALAQCTYEISYHAHEYNATVGREI